MSLRTKLVAYLPRTRGLRLAVAGDGDHSRLRIQGAQYRSVSNSPRQRALLRVPCFYAPLEHWSVGMGSKDMYLLAQCHNMLLCNTTVGSYLHRKWL